MNPMEACIRAIAKRDGIDPNVAMAMTFLEFVRAVAMHRAVRDSERIAIAVMFRGSTVMS